MDFVNAWSGKTEIAAQRNRSAAERHVGRLFQKYSRAARFFQVDLDETDDPAHQSGKRLAIAIAQSEEHREWAELSDSCYLLRTNLQDQDAAALWKTYIGLSQIEDSLRIGKHDLGLRPSTTRRRDALRHTFSYASWPW